MKHVFWHEMGGKTEVNISNIKSLTLFKSRVTWERWGNKRFAEIYTICTPYKHDGMTGVNSTDRRVSRTSWKESMRGS
jgi:hypothetical protein